VARGRVQNVNPICRGIYDQEVIAGGVEGQGIGRRWQVEVACDVVTVHIHPPDPGLLLVTDVDPALCSGCGHTKSPHSGHLYLIQQSAVGGDDAQHSAQMSDVGPIIGGGNQRRVVSDRHGDYDLVACRVYHGDGGIGVVGDVDAACGGRHAPGQVAHGNDVQECAAGHIHYRDCGAVAVGHVDPIAPHGDTVGAFAAGGDCGEKPSADSIHHSYSALVEEADVGLFARSGHALGMLTHIHGG